MINNYLAQPSKEEITIKDIIYFFYESWRVIAACGILGVLGGGGFLVSASSQFEAFAQIRMIHITTDLKNTKANIEEPVILMARLRLPSSFTINEINECGLSQEKNPAEKLVSLIKFSPIKGSDSVVELRVQRESREQAMKCLNVLIELIRQSQTDLLLFEIEKAKKLVTFYNARKQEILGQYNKLKESESNSFWAYFASRDELNFLFNEITRLNFIINDANLHKDLLIAPIYGSTKSIHPVKKFSILLGLSIGLFFGVLLALFRKNCSKLTP